MALEILQGGAVPTFHVMDGGIITVNKETAQKLSIDTSVFSSLAGQVVEVDTAAYPNQHDPHRPRGAVPCGRRVDRMG